MTDLPKTISLMFKTPDAVHNAIEDYVKFAELDEDELFDLKSGIEDKVNKFVRYGEIVTIDLDLETGEATVRKEGLMPHSLDHEYCTVCPVCRNGRFCKGESVDVGIGSVQVSAGICSACGFIESSCYQDNGSYEFYLKCWELQVRPFNSYPFNGMF